MVFSEAVPDQTCPINSPCPLKNTKGLICVPKTVNSMPAVTLSSESVAAESLETKLLRPPEKIPN